MIQRNFAAASRRGFVAMVVLGMASVATGPAHAAQDRVVALAKPTGPVILTVTGKVQNPNAYREASFDMEMLMALPATRIETTTPWTEGVTQFEGVRLDVLLKHIAAKGTVGEFMALNDYAVRIDLADFEKQTAIIAYQMNGKPMSVRNKGPLWVIYPLDHIAESEAAFYRDRMIWQLRSIDIK